MEETETETETDSPGEEEEEELDPRIQSELERLNRASQEINNLELSLEDARSKFRSALNESSNRLDVLSKKLGNCVERARPYYQARMNARTIQAETQKSALRYERACSMHVAAKEMVNVAEQGFLTKGQQFDMAWQEMLNHATTKVNEAETEIMESDLEHMRMTYLFHESEQVVKKLHREHRRSINKSRSYFEMKGDFNRIMEEQKKRVDKVSDELKIHKTIYSCALKTLERISEEIHAERAKRRARHVLGIRVDGVGAEDPDPSPEEEREANTTIKVEPDVDLSKLDIADSSPVRVKQHLESPSPSRDVTRRSKSPSSRSSRSPSKDSASLILSVGALNEEFPSLPYAKVTPNVAKDAAVAKETVDEDDNSKARDTVSKGTPSVSVPENSGAGGGVVVKDSASKDAVSVDSEEFLDTDSDTSSVHVPDDDMVADALNDFTDEDFPAEPKFMTLPANMNFSDLKTFFKQGELKKWGDEDNLH